MDNPPPSILIVDDEPNVLLTLNALLRQEGYETQGAAGGSAAIRSLRERNFDLVLTDLKMPDVDGLAVLQEVRDRSPDTVTIMMTGYGSIDSALEAVQLGAYEYLLKPVEVPDLKAAVRRSLERKRFSEVDTLYRITQTLTRTWDSQRIAAEVEDAARRVCSLAQARVIVMDRNLRPLACIPELREKISDPDILRRLQSGSIEIVPPPTTTPASSIAGTLAAALIPGIANQRLVCVLAVDNGPKTYDFHAPALRFLQALASQAALALDNAAVIEELQAGNRELQFANQKLRELDQLKSQFLGVATHELRTPLSIILGYQEMLGEQLAGRLSVEESEILHESTEACQRLIRLVNSMLDLTQIQAGKLHMNLAPTDLPALVSRVTGRFQEQARRKNLKLTLEIPSSFPAATLDAERMEQVLVNLLANAVKFTSEGEIIVALRVNQDGGAEVLVQDTGVGIAPEHQSSIFDEFTQIREHTDARHRDGAGLGLAIARRIVEAHHGRLQVTSARGQGSTFRVAIPIHSHSEGDKSLGEACCA